ncbi:hypothetical protein BV898_08647 [Hypsibius exemplaris]|uniref:Uncharacterized protein n=1 Tax=Hypsibius exemplaris TaxID=2072580 RepID=A0A1W0WPW1_HYPEX|nr:hypothetical protein BV898_08647 [Hypsibius exemplaris]
MEGQSINRVSERLLRSADIHAVDSEVRLLEVTSDQKSLRFLEPNLSGATVLAKAVKTLASWRDEASKESPIEPELTHCYKKLRQEGKSPLEDADYLYRAVVLRALRDEFMTDQRKCVLTLFTNWIVFHPSVERVLDEQEGPARDAERLRKIDDVPRFREPELRRRLTNVMARVNEFAWKSISPVEGKYQPAPEISQFLSDMEISPRSWTFPPNKRFDHRSRILSRLCRVTVDPFSVSAQKHFDQTVAQMASTSPSGSATATDIEDSLVALASEICLEEGPKCRECPLRSVCGAYKFQSANEPFLRLFYRQPSFTAHSVAVVCREGLECRLCSLDPMEDSYCAGKGVMMFPVLKQRLERKNVAMVMVRNQTSGQFLFEVLQLAAVGMGAKKGRKKKGEVPPEPEKIYPYQLFRVDLPIHMPPSSEEALRTVREQLHGHLPGTTLTVERNRRSDQREEIPCKGTLQVLYVYLATVDGNENVSDIKNESTSAERFFGVKAADLLPDMLSPCDWKLFQTFLLFHQQPQPATEETTAGRQVPRSRQDLPPRKRLTALEEACLKRYPTFRFEK